jgi:hypothetical protein
MNHGKTLAAALIVSMLLAGSAQGTPELGGVLTTDNRWRPGGDDDGYTWNEVQLGLKLDVRHADAMFHSESHIRYSGFPDVHSSADLQDSDRIQPWHLEMYEAYIDVYGLFLDNVDVRIGKQRVAWGTADKLNVVDNLNPDDFEDILDIGRKIPTTAVRVDYYPGDFTVTGVVVPVFTPARSPSSSWQVPASFPLSPELSLGVLTDEVTLPDSRPQDTASIGLRIRKELLGYDCSVSYVYGRDDWPLPSAVNITPVDTLGTVDVHMTLEYPRQQVVGVDIAGAVEDVGIWAECALFVPTEGTYTAITSPDGVLNQLALSDDPYVKYVVGGDYTFRNGLYVNGQYLHGFFTDRGTDGLEDYFLIAIERDFLRSELTVRLALAAEVADFEDVANYSAFFGGPELTYHPTNNAEIVIGALFLEGNSSTQFGQFDNNDEIYFRVKYSF